MTAMNKLDHFLDEGRPIIALSKQRLQPLNPRNYNSAKQLATNGLEIQGQKNMADKSKFLQRILPSIDRQEHKNNHSYRLKVFNQRERSEVIRKNASLKLLRREEEFRTAHRPKEEEIKHLQTLLVREDRASLEAQSQNSIPLKKGQLVKRSHNYLRIIKKKQEEHQPQKNDVSFEEGLHLQQEKGVPGIICSQNLLGGMRKYSSAKLKVFVTNPFEKMMRHHQEIKEAQSHQITPEQAQQFKQSQIYQQSEDGCASITQQQQLLQLLGML